MAGRAVRPHGGARPPRARDGRRPSAGVTTAARRPDGPRGGRGLPVRLARKRIKNVNLRVKADGRVEVSAPLHATDAFVASFVRERPWIEAKRAG